MPHFRIGFHTGSSHRPLLRKLLCSIPCIKPSDMPSLFLQVTYSLSGHALDVATIFSALQFFNVIRDPLVFFPFSVSMCADAAVAIQRIGRFLRAEEAEEAYVIDNSEDNPTAVKVDGDFVWEIVEKPNLDAANVPAKDVRGGTRRKWFPRKKAETLPTSWKVEGAAHKVKAKDECYIDKPFALRVSNFTVPKGGFVAIVGRVGSGKSSLLQAMNGEMRRTRGEVEVRRIMQ